MYEQFDMIHRDFFRWFVYHELLLDQLMPNIMKTKKITCTQKQLDSNNEYSLERINELL